MLNKAKHFGPKTSRLEDDELLRLRLKVTPRFLQTIEDSRP